jgi:hypothetical protein
MRCMFGIGGREPSGPHLSCPQVSSTRASKSAQSPNPAPATNESQLSANCSSSNAKGHISVPPSARASCAPWLAAMTKQMAVVAVLVATRYSPLLHYVLIMRWSAGMVVPRTPAKRMFAPSGLPSASLPIWDILFPPLFSGRKPAECGHSGQIVRTTRPLDGPTSGRLSSLSGPLSPRQPNHGHFGTDVGI